MDELGESLGVQFEERVRYEAMKNYRICFDFAAETPTKAIIYLLGIVEDPESREKPLEWLVIDQETGEEHKIRRSLAELDAEARADLKKFLG